MRTLLVLLVLTGCTATPELPPVDSPSLPPAEWLEDCPVTARSDASNRALRQAWKDNLQSLADCNSKLGSLRSWREEAAR